jgi:hypothetical protein
MAASESSATRRPGRPPSPDPKLARVSVALTADQWTRASVEAARRGVPLAEVLRAGIPSAAPEGVIRGDVGGLGVSRRA